MEQNSHSEEIYFLDRHINSRSRWNREFYCHISKANHWAYARLILYVPYPIYLWLTLILSHLLLDLPSSSTQIFIFCPVLSPRLGDPAVLCLITFIIFYNSRTPLIRKLVIRNGLALLCKRVKNPTCLEVTSDWVNYSTLLWLKAWTKILEVGK